MKKMKTDKAKIRICKFPNCNKEPHNDRAMFCLEHDRNIKSKSKEVMTGVVSIVGLGVLVVKKIIKSK